VLDQSLSFRRSVRRSEAAYQRRTNTDCSSRGSPCSSDDGQAQVLAVRALHSVGPAGEEDAAATSRPCGERVGEPGQQVRARVVAVEALRHLVHAVEDQQEAAGASSSRRPRPSARRGRWPRSTTRSSPPAPCGSTGPFRRDPHVPAHWRSGHSSGNKPRNAAGSFSSNSPGSGDGCRGTSPRGHATARASDRTSIFRSPARPARRATPCRPGAGAARAVLPACSAACARRRVPPAGRGQRRHVDLRQADVLALPGCRARAARPFRTLRAATPGSLADGGSDVRGLFQMGRVPSLRASALGAFPELVEGLDDRGRKLLRRPEERGTLVAAATGAIPESLDSLRWMLFV